MELQLLQFSIVVRGNQHNPTIINRDFLEIRGIIPKEWNFEVDESGIITTPALAQVKYKNGVIVRVEPTVAQLADPNITEPMDSKIILAALKFVETLMHVRYEAVGVNFHHLLEHENPESFLKERYLKSGPWDSNEHPVKAVGLNLAYTISDGVFNLSADPVIAKRKDEQEKTEKKGLLFKANFHRDCDEYPAVNQIKDYLERIPDDWKFYNLVITDLLRS